MNQADKISMSSGRYDSNRSTPNTRCSGRNMEMWEAFGFRESPYNTNPLKPRREDIELLVGREAEAIELCTQLESATNGVVILSGLPGVGKTSFFNVQQFRLENSMALFGPKLLAARLLCPVLPNDNPRSLALRALDSLCHSIKAWCSLHSRTIPKETQKIGTWLAGTGSSTFTVELPIMGLGGNVVRTIQLPKATEAPIEAIANALAALAAEAVNKLQFDGVFVALENLENLSDDELASMLISFRETLFAIPNVWWVLIGQSGLGSLIQSLDPRVADRTTGSGIEIGPIELEELEHAIALRVSRFRKSSKALSPLTSHTHRHLFEASDGEMRSLFKYSSSICARFVKEMRSNVLKNSTSKPSLPNSRINRNQFEQTLHNAVGEELVNSQIPHLIAENYLNAIVESELKGLFLKPMEETVLEGIGNKGNTYANDYDDFGLCSMQEFSSNYLSKLYEQKLLTCQHEGREVNYRLHGIAKLSHSFGLLRYQVPSSCIIFKFPKQDFETITHHD